MHYQLSSWNYLYHNLIVGFFAWSTRVFGQPPVSVYKYVKRKKFFSHHNISQELKDSNDTTLVQIGIIGQILYVFKLQKFSGPLYDY